MSENKIVSLRDISKKFDNACKLEESQMNSFKRPGSLDRNDYHAMDEALRKARSKAEKEIFKQKVQANLIIGIALIVVLCLLNWG